MRASTVTLPSLGLAECGKKAIQRHVARNDTQGEIHRPKALGLVIGRSAKFAPGASQDPTTMGVASERIHQPAA